MSRPLGIFALSLIVFVSACAGEDTRPFELEISGEWIGNAICYGPHRDGQRPGESEPSREQLVEDLEILDEHWKLLRIYGASGFARTLLDVIQQSGSEMKVVLGVWIAPDSPDANQAEIDAGIELANAFPEIVAAVSVGNETQIDWSAHRVPLEELVAAVRQVRSSVRIPVTSADDFNFWNKPASLELAPELDFLMVHAHPMWNGLQLEDALDWLEKEIGRVQDLHADRLLVLGETGWATMVHDEGEQARLIKGSPGESEQTMFHEQIRQWAIDRNQAVFFFEAFDENWKGGNHPNEVEKHWGLFRADRTPKQAMHGDTGP